MTAHNHSLHSDFSIHDDGEAKLDELARLQERFRRHYIFRDVIPGRGVRYLAHSRTAGVRPHTVITDDLAELGEVLERASPGELAAGSRGIHGHAVGPRSPGPRPGDRGPGTAAGFQVSGGELDIGPAGLEEAQLAGLRHPAGFR